MNSKETPRSRNTNLAFLHVAEWHITQLFMTYRKSALSRLTAWFYGSQYRQSISFISKLVNSSQCFSVTIK